MGHWRHRGPYPVRGVPCAAAALSKVEAVIAAVGSSFVRGTLKRFVIDMQARRSPGDVTPAVKYAFSMKADVFPAELGLLSDVPETSLILPPRAAAQHRTARIPAQRLPPERPQQAYYARVLRWYCIARGLLCSTEDGRSMVVSRDAVHTVSAPYTSVATNTPQ